MHFPGWPYSLTKQVLVGKRIGIKNSNIGLGPGVTVRQWNETNYYFLGSRRAVSHIALSARPGLKWARRHSWHWQHRQYANMRVLRCCQSQCIVRWIVVEMATGWMIQRAANLFRCWRTYNGRVKLLVPTKSMMIEPEGFRPNASGCGIVGKYGRVE